MLLRMMLYAVAYMQLDYTLSDSDSDSDQYQEDEKNASDGDGDCNGEDGVDSVGEMDQEGPIM